VPRISGITSTEEQPQEDRADRLGDAHGDVERARIAEQQVSRDAERGPDAEAREHAERRMQRTSRYAPGLDEDLRVLLGRPQILERLRDAPRPTLPVRRAGDVVDAAVRPSVSMNSSGE
jgi:hypothetical protein